MPPSGAVRVQRLPWLGPGQVAVQVARAEASARISTRIAALCGVLAGVIAVVLAVNVSVGDFPIPLTDVLPGMAGLGNPDADFIIHTLRLPRSLTGLLVGFAFGLSGAIFQSLARNPLASPDIIGINAGATLGAVLVIVEFAGGTVAAAGGALAGALGAAIGVYLLAYKQGVTGYRLILVGIGITAVLSSLTSYLLTRGNVYNARQAEVWLTGSLNGRGWEHVGPVGAALLVLVPATLVLARQLRGLQLGDECARGLGVPVELARSGLIMAAVGLAAVATASAGPVVFVALVAPQIARRLAGQATIVLVPAALIGALITLTADLIGRRAFAPVELPVGVITAVVGAPYLLWLLARGNRIGKGG